MADHPHTIDRWDDATGENLIEQIAAVGDYLVAPETYRAAVKRWPKDEISCATGRGSLRSRGRTSRERPLASPPVRSLIAWIGGGLLSIPFDPFSSAQKPG
jgi:hypothetical protein